MYHFIMNENNWKARWSKEQIRAMLMEQFESFKKLDLGIKREKMKEVEQAAKSPYAVIISGLRRAGKSTLLAQMAHRIGFDKFFYINFEDDRFLGFQAADANDLYQLLVETFGERKTFIIDEIQNIEGWEHFVRRFMDQGFKFYITGSNASLLSRELGTHLTGRYIPIELFPFSFKEFLRFQGDDIPDFHRITTVERANLNSAFWGYLNSGGIPDALKYPDLPILQSLYDDVLYRDIATRYRLEAVTALKELAFFLISNPTGLVSYNKLKERLRLGSVNTVSSYIEYMENSWLIFTLNLYAYSIKRQQIAPKKIFCIDNGIINDVGFHFSPNTGKLMENSVFLALRQQSKEIYYMKTPGGFEIDFYLPAQRQLVQVSKTLDDPATRKREFRAIEDAIREVSVETALVLSENNEEDTEIGGLKVKVQSIAEWLVT